MESIIRKIQLDIDNIKRDIALYEETNFSNRVNALEFLEFNIIEQIETQLRTTSQSAELTGLKQQAMTIRDKLEKINDHLFQRFRQNIASGSYIGTEFREQIAGYASANQSGGHEEYDSLDLLVNGLLLTEIVPDVSRQQDPESVFYQPTPARIVLGMVTQGYFCRDGVFYDIGSGLGQVAMLVHLLSGIRAKGVEIEPAYCEYARQNAKQLNLSRVEFIHADARAVDYTDGTIFFLYTPCKGKMLEQVLARLKDDSSTRNIRLHTYGPCTQQVARQSWLKRVDQNSYHKHGVTTFKNLPEE